MLAMPAFIESSTSSRTKCKVCGETIAKATLRVIDETLYFDGNGERSRRVYWHLLCAAEMQREIAYAALVGSQTTDDMFARAIASVGAVDTKLVDESRAHRRKPVAKRALPLTDPMTGQLLADLEANPSDRDLLAVLADQLLQQGDERGELIMLDLNAVEVVSGERDLSAIRRRSALATSMTAPLQAPDRGTWGIGFYRKLSVRFRSKEALVELLAHPTCRLLEALEITHAETLQLSASEVPRTLRSLRVRGALAAESDLAGLPYLEQLAIGGFDSLAHPGLRSLELEHGTRKMRDALVPDRLPALIEISLIWHGSEYVVDDLARNGWFQQLTSLSLAHMLFDSDDLARLERALDGRKLDSLTVIGTRIPEAERPRLAALCDELEVVFAYVPTEPSGPVHIEHITKPEWGLGRLVREYDGKVEVTFEVGTKTFKADAPFLKRR